MANSIAKLAILLTTDTSGMQRGFNQARSQVQGFNQEMSGAGGLMALGTKAGAIGTAAAAAVALASVTAKAVSWATKLGEESNIAAINFRTMMGDAVAAQSLLGGIREFAMESPFAASDLQQAAQTMLAFGMNAEKVLPTLKNIGDISLGNSDKMRLLTLAFSQTQAAGKLMGQDLLQMVNAGFNPLQEIARVTGRDMNELREAMSNGAISAEMVAAAFKSATQEGGRFHEAIKAIEGSMSGQWAKLKENATEIVRPFGEDAASGIANILKNINAGLQIATKGWDGYALSLHKANEESRQIVEMPKPRWVDAPKGDFLFNIDRLRAAQDAVAKIGKGGEEFAKRFRTPGQDFAASAATAAALLRDGGISAEVYKRAMAAAKENLRETMFDAEKFRNENQYRDNPALSRSNGAAFSEIARIQQNQRTEDQIAAKSLEVENRIAGFLERILKATERNEAVRINEVDF